MRSRVCSLFIVSLLCLTPAVFAQEEPAPAPVPDPGEYSDSGFGMDISAYGLVGFGWHINFGFGAQFAYPIVPNGFITNPRFRDALHIEGGLDYGYWYWSVGPADWSLSLLTPMVGARYAVYVLESLAPFATLKIGAAIPVAHSGYVHDPSVYFYLLGSVGIMYDFNDMISLRAEVGYQYIGSSADIWKIGVLFRI